MHVYIYIYTHTRDSFWIRFLHCIVARRASNYTSNYPGPSVHPYVCASCMSRHISSICRVSYMSQHISATNDMYGPGDTYLPDTYVEALSLMLKYMYRYMCVCIRIYHPYTYHSYTYVSPICIRMYCPSTYHPYTYVSPICIRMYHPGDTYTHVSICIHTYTGGWYISIRIHMYRYIHIRIRVGDTYASVIHSYARQDNSLHTPSWVYVNSCLVLHGYTCTYMHMYTQTYVYVSTCIHMYTYICIHTCLSKHVYLCAYETHLLS